MVPHLGNAADFTAADFTHVEHWVFDLDNTLYSAEVNLFAQVDRRMTGFIARTLDLPRDAAHALQHLYYRRFGTTLNGLMERHGVDPRAFLDDVHDIDLSRVDPDPGLSDALARLPGRKLVFTNGPLFHAENVVAALGLAHHFDDIVDIEATGYTPKHEPQAFDRFLARAGVEAPAAAMFDDVALNLRTAHGLGMTTIWIRTETDWSAGQPVDEMRAHIHYQTDGLERFLKDLRHAGHAAAGENDRFC